MLLLRHPSGSDPCSFGFAVLSPNGLSLAVQDVVMLGLSTRTSRLTVVFQSVSDRHHCCAGFLSPFLLQRED